MEKSDIVGPHGPSYVEIRPPASLSSDVARLWELRDPATGDARVRILPNASIDIVIYRTDASHGEGDASAVAPPNRSFIVGSALRHFFVRSTGSRHIIGATLTPSGVHPILGVPAAAIGVGIYTLSDVIGSTAASDLEERVLIDSPISTLERLGDALLRIRGSREADPQLARAIGSVREAGGTLRVDAVAAQTNMSSRQLERRFLAQFGMSPKTFARLVRFDRAVRNLPRRGNRSWSRFALDHGYSDQSHFINEVREFAGLTPLELEAELDVRTQLPLQRE